MFLRGLLRKEKELFWELANHLIFTDGSLADGEVEMMKAYLTELEESSFEIGKPVKTVEEILIDKPQIDNRTGKIIFFELLELCYADKEYSATEKILISELKKEFMITDAEETEMLDVIREITVAYQKLSKILGE